MSTDYITDPSSDSHWLTVYSDIFTSLVAFFVLIVSISTIDQEKVEYIQESIQKTILKQTYEKPFTTLAEKLNEIIRERQLEQDVFVLSKPAGIDIVFSSRILYESGSAELQKPIVPFLRDMATLIQQMAYTDILIEVEGHTDSLPIQTIEFPSNWELSASRATRVVRFFMANGIQKNTLKASGFADSRPRYVNGKPVTDTSLNRRINVIIRRNKYSNMPKTS
jgi:chemotaxis protein MotB